MNTIILSLTLFLTAAAPNVEKQLDEVKEAEAQIKQEGSQEQESPFEEQTAVPIDPCATLSADEQAFADTLDVHHRRIFCIEFSSTLRKIAMNMTGKKDSKEEIISSNRAIDLVLSQYDLESPISEEAKEKINP